MNVLGREIGIATISSVVSAAFIALIGAILAVLKGWFAPLINWFLSSTNVPTWLMALLLLALTASLGVHVFQWWRRRSSPLTPNEQKVMNVLADQHPRRLSAAQLARMIKESSVLTEAAISSLSNQGYISFPLSVYEETTYYLTGEGLNFIAKRQA